MVGLACAYELASRGAAVCVLERGRIGEGASKGNTGWITASFSYPLAAPGVIRSGMRSALSADGALVIRPSLDPAFLRWLWRFRRALDRERVPRGDPGPDAIERSYV